MPLELTLAQDHEVYSIALETRFKELLESFLKTRGHRSNYEEEEEDFALYFSFKSYLNSTVRRRQLRDYDCGDHFNYLRRFGYSPLVSAQELIRRLHIFCKNNIGKTLSKE